MNKLKESSERSTKRFNWYNVRIGKFMFILNYSKIQRNSTANLQNDIRHCFDENKV
jgi:bacteriorhodopsin